MITYETARPRIVRVKLDGKWVGTIRRDRGGARDGWRYFPKGKKTGGDSFPTLIECKRSLETV